MSSLSCSSVLKNLILNVYLYENVYSIVPCRFRRHHGVGSGEDRWTREGVSDLPRVYQHSQTLGQRNQSWQGERFQGTTNGMMGGDIFGWKFCLVGLSLNTNEPVLMFYSKTKTSLCRWIRSSISCSSSSRTLTCSVWRSTGFTWTDVCSADWRTFTDPPSTNWEPACTDTTSSIPFRYQHVEMLPAHL